MISEVARSSVNVANGGKTRWANFFHGIFILIFLIFAVSFSNYIPNAALAAMLIGVGYKLANPKENIRTNPCLDNVPRKSYTFQEMGITHGISMASCRFLPRLATIAYTCRFRLSFKRKYVCFCRIWEYYYLSIRINYC